MLLAGPGRYVLGLDVSNAAGMASARPYKLVFMVSDKEFIATTCYFGR